MTSVQKLPEPDLLRFTTAGSVDDGKSTLIGRLLHDASGLYEDHLDALRIRAERDGKPLDFAFVTDGLKAEREQGITIDVAYRYFATARRRFIIADTPGHVQYTRNMATGASTADLAVILVDARLGVLTQSKRHGFIASLLGIPRVVVAVNKMDLVGYDKAVFDRIHAEYAEFAARLGFADLTFIPISALVGDNVVSRSPRMPWYDGVPLLTYLETVYVGGDRNLIDFRFPVQRVSAAEPGVPRLQRAGGLRRRAAGGRDHRAALGPAIPRRPHRDVRRRPRPCATRRSSVTLCLADDIDVGRGDMIAHPNNVPQRRALDRGDGRVDGRPRRLQPDTPIW